MLRHYIAQKATMEQQRTIVIISGNECMDNKQQNMSVSNKVNIKLETMKILI